MVEVCLTLGSIMKIEAADRYNPDDGPLRIMVSGVRAAANEPLRDEWVWVEGVRVSNRAHAAAPMSALVRASLFAPTGPARR